MATSGSIDFSRNRNQIITDAYQILNIYGADEIVTPGDLVVATTRLNSLVKSLQVQGYSLWREEEGVLFLNKEQSSYDIGSGSTDHATLASNLVETTLSADEALGQTVISVTSSTGMTAADKVGIIQSDNTLHWSTIVSVDSATQITITDATTVAASSGAKVYTYTTDAQRPLYITSIRRQDNSNNEVPLHSASRQEYFDLPNKSAAGIPIQYYYDPKIGLGKVYVYLTPNDEKVKLRYSFVRTFEDFDNSTDTPDMPQEWYDALTFNLAVRLGLIFGKGGTPEYQDLKDQAFMMLEEAKSFDSEKTSINIQFDSRGY